MVRAESRQRTIVRNPGILHGEPTVRTIVLARSTFGSAERVQEQLPTLTVPDIEAALGYDRSHRDEINQHIAENTGDEEIPYGELG